MFLKSLPLLAFSAAVALASCSKKDALPDVKKEFTICNQLAELGANTGFVAKIRSLYEEAKANNYETGYILYPSIAQTFRFDRVEGVPGAASINFDIDGLADGFIHCHYSNLYPTFSGSDIRAIYQAYDNEQINNTQTFICGVVSATGNAYLLKIVDLNQFRAFAQKYFVQTSDFRNFEYSYHNQQQGYLSSKGLVISFELALLEMLQDSGLALFKAATGFSLWQRIEKDASSNVVAGSCK